MGLQKECECMGGDCALSSCQNGAMSSLVYREKFLQCLGRFSTSVERHVKELEKAMLASAKETRPGEPTGEKDRLARFDVVWKPEFERLFDRIAVFEKSLDLKPSLCVMGRRGAGKTTLLMSWLGKTKKQNGLSVLKRLPHGAEDTTACLVRLSASKTPLSESVLEVSLLSRDVMRDVEHRPERPDRDFFHVLAEPEDTKPYWLCRFPMSGRDNGYSLGKRDGRYVVSEDGDIPLESVQWHAREVRIPLDVSSQNTGMAGQILAEVDLVDSPGADSTRQGGYGEWKKKKNAEVFKVAVEDLDMLLLVSASNVSAINLGGQFQDDIWRPWSERCGGRGEGRLMIVFSHATEVLKTAMRKLQDEDEDDDEAKNDSFGRMLYKNIFMPLFDKSGNSENAFSILDQDDISTWPPFFFYDKDCEWLLDKFKEDFPPGTGEEKAERLCSIMEGAEVEGDFSNAERCILDLASQCDDIRHENPNVDTVLLKRWVIRSLCAFFDPADRGLALLTRYVVEYASRGPAALNHAEDRMDRAEELFEAYIGFLEKLAQPHSNLEAEAALRSASSEMSTLWEKHPAGPKFRLGKSAEGLLNKALRNLSPAYQKKDVFDRDDILTAAVKDALLCEEMRDKGRSAGAGDAVLRVLVRCLSADFVLARLFENKKELLGKYPGELQSFFSAVMERMPRVMEYLKNAGEDRLREVAANCFEMDVVNLALLRPVLEASLEKERPETAAALDEARSAFASFEGFLASNPINLPFARPTPSGSIVGLPNPLPEEGGRES